MDPVTLGIGATIAGAAVSAFGSMQSGAASAATYQYQAGVAAMNQQVAKQNAAYALTVGESQAQMQGLKTSAQMASTKTAQAASGLDVNSGTNVTVRESEHEIGQFEQASIRADAARKAYGYEVEASNKQAQENLYQASAQQSKTAGTIGAIGSLLGGASSVSSKWLQAKQVGLY